MDDISRSIHFDMMLSSTIRCPAVNCVYKPF